MVASNDDLVFLDDSEDGTGDAANLQPWRVLVVDDDQDVHEATRFALAHLLILGRPLELLHAHSACEALELLQREGDIAVILLDVVMESDDAGLRTVGVIREQLKMLNTRIILRTGQPGQAPEADTIARYDINDYKTKSELTQNKLFTTLTAAFVRTTSCCGWTPTGGGWKKSSLPATSSLPKRACARLPKASSRRLPA